MKLFQSVRALPLVEQYRDQNFVNKHAFLMEQRLPLSFFTSPAKDQLRAEKRRKGYQYSGWNQKKNRGKKEKKKKKKKKKRKKKKKKKLGKKRDKFDEAVLSIHLQREILLCSCESSFWRGPHKKDNLLYVSVYAVWFYGGVY